MHVYILERSDPDKHDQLSRLFTGPLNQFAMPNTPAPPKVLRPPSWSRTPQAHVEAFRKMREQQAAAQQRSG